MNDFFSETVFWISLFAGITSTLSVVSHFIYRRKKEELSEKIEESELNKVIQSNDLKQLGNYLDDSLSKIRLSQYSSSSSVSYRVDRYLELLKEFVGTTEEINKDSQEATKFKKEFKEPEANKPLIKRKKAHPEFESILNELENGEVWNALAQLRRFIEIELRKIARSLDLMVRTKNPSSGQLLERLWKRKVIELDIYTDLKLSISVCNQAIHGFDVEYDEAVEAINNAFSAWQQLNQKYPGL